MRFLFFFIIGFVLLGCKNSNEEESYKIYNEVLKEKVSTYGIILNFIKFPNNYTSKELDKKLDRISDSLKRSNSLTFYLDSTLPVYDTVTRREIFNNTKEKLDFNKINELKFAARIEKREPIDENTQKPKYLGIYKLSKPIFICENKAVVKLDHYCGGDCGVGILIYLRKIKNQWKIIKEKQIYIL